MQLPILDKAQIDDMHVRTLSIITQQFFMMLVT
jgi:hypothetical protein